MEHILVNPVVQFLINTTLGRIIIVFAGLFDLLFIGLVLARGTTKRLIKDLGLARHILVTWFIVPFFRIYFWLLEISGKLQFRVNEPIPWEEEKLIFAGNHPMPKMQDTFLLPVIIFFLRPQNYLNPIRYFPKSTADEANFVKSWFFRVVGDRSLRSITRNRKGKTNNSSMSPIEEGKKDFEEYGGTEIFYVERGRTKSAILKKRVKIKISSAGEILVLGRLGIGAACLSLKTNTPIIPWWSRIEGDDSYPKASPFIVLLGLIELLVIPRRRIYIDINHPSGPLRPQIGKETPKQLTQRLENCLFEIGDIQSKRLKGKG